MKKTIVLLLCVIGIKAFAQYSTPCLDYRVPGILTDLGVVQSLILTNWPDYTNTVAKAAAAVTTNDTRQLDFTGADVRIADATQSNQPVTKAQLDGLLPASPVAGDLVKYDGTNWVATAKTWLEEDTVVYFYPTNTLTEIEDTINALPRNLNNKSLYLAFHDGTYNFERTLVVNGFVGGAVVFCSTSLTASSSTVAYTNQPVIMKNNGLLNASAVVQFGGCSDLRVYDVRFWYSDAHTNKNACVAIGCNGAIYASMFSGETTNATVNMSGLTTQRSTFDLRANYLNNVRYGMSIQKGSVVAIETHASGPVRPACDIRSINGSIVGVNQTGLTVSALAAGLLINSDGAILP